LTLGPFAVFTRVLVFHVHAYARPPTFLTYKFSSVMRAELLLIVLFACLGDMAIRGCLCFSRNLLRILALHSLFCVTSFDDWKILYTGVLEKKVKLSWGIILKPPQGEVFRLPSSGERHVSAATARSSIWFHNGESQRVNSLSLNTDAWDAFLVHAKAEGNSL